jgi:hypothetical protein
MYETRSWAMKSSQLPVVGEFVKKLPPSTEASGTTTIISRDPCAAMSESMTAATSTPRGGTPTHMKSFVPNPCRRYTTGNRATTDAS